MNDRKPTIDPTTAISLSRENTSDQPLVTARYTIEIVMNEAYVERTPEEHKKALADVMQRASDEGFFNDVVYNYIELQVTDRVELDVAPAANYPDLPENPTPQA